MKRAALALCLALATLFAGASAQAQTRFPPAQTGALTVRTNLGCGIDWRGYLSLQNTTTRVLRVGTPVYWTGKQQGQAEPHQYSAPLYADVAPGGSYQIGGVYRYDGRVACQMWIVSRQAATRAP